MSHDHINSAITSKMNGINMIQKQKLKHVVISETNFLALKTLGNKYGYGVTDSLNDVVTMVLREVGSRT